MNQETTNMRILIIEAYTDANVGSCALVGSTIRILKTYFPSAEIRIMAHWPSAFQKLYDCPSVQDVFKYPFKQMRLKQILWGCRTLFWMSGALVAASFEHESTPKSERFPFHKQLEHYLWSDLVVSVGAERLNDKYYKNIPFSLYTYFLVKLLGRKMVLFPQTSGPFFFLLTKLLTRTVLNKVDLVFTRDAESTRLLCEEIKVSRKRVVESADVAVLEESISREEALVMLGASTDDMLVGISAMRWSYFKNRIETPYSNFLAYQREMVKVVDTIVSRYGATVVLFPTNFPIHGSREDDVTTCAEIRSNVKQPDKVKLISELPTPSQLMGMLGCCNVNITTRMHACILSTNAFVPTISINYLFKVKEYMKSLGLGDFSLDIEMFSADLVLPAFQRIWREQDKWRDHLRKTIAERRKRLWKTMEALDALD